MRRDGGAGVRSRWAVSAALLGISAAALPSLSVADRVEGQLRPFTVRDSIGMTRIVDPDVALSQFGEPTVKVAPGGRAFVVVTRKGDLDTGLNEYSLILFETADVLAFVNAPSRTHLPRQHVLAKFRTASAKHAIDDVQWLPDGEAVAFVGRPPGAVGAVFVLDLRTREMHEISHDPRDIARFTLACDGNVLLYSVPTKRDWRSARALGYVVQSETLSEVVRTEDVGDGALLTHVLVDLRTAETREIALPPNRNYRPDALSASPACRWAVTPILLQHLPARWSDYAFLRRYLDLARQGAMVAADPSGHEEYLVAPAFGGPSTWLAQYYRIDLTTGHATPLLDAPAPRQGPALPILWTADGQGVIVPRAFLPLDVANPEERARRAAAAAVAAIDLDTGTATRVADAMGPMSERLVSIEWADEDRLLIQHRADGTPRTIASLCRTDGQCDAVTHWRGDARLELSVVQDANTPPEIRARDRRTTRERIITDFNPQLRQLDLGRVEAFAWSDRFGRTFTGGLVLPSRHQASRRLPVVIQTYGFAPTEFLVDGPNGVTTAYAARALAGRGILVLQIPPADARTTRGSRDRTENDLFVAAIEGAIDALDSRGWIDRERVGLIGWSREGMHVQHAVAFSNYPIAAATIADAVAATPFCYAAFYGKAYPAMLDFEYAEGSIGAPFWGDGLERWLQRSPIFHLDRIRTPTRYEHLGLSTFPCHWDIFALLKRYGRPVEMLHIPEATHIIQQPKARYLSQEGNVDWFAFWLKGEEDPDPAKASQYERWRKLRALRDVQLRGPPMRSLTP